MDHIRKVVAVALHRYFIWADRMREHFLQSLPAEWEPGEPIREPIEVRLYMSYWYAALYVVVEGWQNLELAHPNVEPLLDAKRIDLLRRFRNGVFHFQPDYSFSPPVRLPPQREPRFAEPLISSTLHGPGRRRTAG